MCHPVERATPQKRRILSVPANLQYDAFVDGGELFWREIAAIFSHLSLSTEKSRHFMNLQKSKLSIKIF